MMRWRSDPSSADSSEVAHSPSGKSNIDFEPDSSTTSCADTMANKSAQIHALGDIQWSHGSTETMLSSSSDKFNGQQHSDQQENTAEFEMKHDNAIGNSGLDNLRDVSSHKRDLTDGEPPDTSTDTDTTANSQAAAASHMDDDDDDGADHATEDDDTKSQSNLPWKPQNVQSTCEFTHNILDYAQKRESGCKKAEYSAVTTDELGNRWRLIVYVNGNGRASNHHLSLFLQVADADDLPFGWKKSVSYVLTLEHPAGGNLSYAKRNPDKTFKLCPKAIDWGWSQFITSDRIQQEGFVHADSLTVRAQVTVKSSSVEIDEEDAELYLKCAVEEGDAASVKLCLDQGASVNCQFKDDLYTPLHTACSSGTAAGSMDVLQLLLEKGADGNACNKWRESPLLIAANNGHRQAVEALLQHGANPSLCSEAGWSALTFAAHKGYDDIVALLLAAGAPVNCPVTEDLSTPLHKACAGSKLGHLAAVKLLLDGGANVHALNKWRETPLLTAANHGQAGSVEALLAAGADPCKCTDTGWSPLSIAAYKGHDDVVRILLEEGAPTEEDDPTLSALLQAATKGLPDTVELLLRHGADHTVTTKKGDTALSILVEQNLIDAAVEMVTEYNASIPRCSRDRKKVQRARLLINLRMKQLEKEGKENPDSTDDEDTDDEFMGKNSAQHVEEDDDNASFSSSVNSKDGKKKKKNQAKLSAVEKARAAEEALLLELEQEESQAKKVEAEASTKRAKKKKKKERERQQKVKEERERQLREEKEAMEREERERIKKEKEERERRERELKLQQEKEREMREVMEKEKSLIAKRKAREERERREKEVKQPAKGRKVANKDARASVSPPPSRSHSNDKRGITNVKGRKYATESTPNKKAISPKSKSTKPTAPLTGNRRWETTAPKQNNPVPSKPGQPLDGTIIDQGLLVPQPVSVKDESNSKLLPLLDHASNVYAHTDSLPCIPTQFDDKSMPSTIDKVDARSDAQQYVNGSRTQIAQSDSVHTTHKVEHPAIALFRRDKVSEILLRCSSALNNLLDGSAFKRVVYRWILRASHSQFSYIDPFIPSWTDVSELTAFFQRQFISESRRQFSARAPMTALPSIESLKEAGASIALYCQNVAKQVLDYRLRIEEQLPSVWTDAELGMLASNESMNGDAPVITLTWANRASVYLPHPTIASLRDRYAGSSSPHCFLASVFVAKIWYETSRLVTEDAATDFRLTSRTQSCLASEAAVSGELFSDPFTALSTNVFWGRYEQVDALFGGQKPFAKDDQGSEEVLARLGGSVSVLLPLDNIVASQYVHRMVDLLDKATVVNTPVSFAVFVHAECFLDLGENGPLASDLCRLDPRLVENQNKWCYVKRIEILRPGAHMFRTGDAEESLKLSTSPSLFLLLQNDLGLARFGLSESSVSQIVGSMGPPLETKLSFDIPSEFPTTNESHLQDTAHFMNNQVTFDSRPSMRSDVTMMTGTFIPVSSFSPASTNKEIVPRGRRGRLFALEDDGEEDQLGDVDIMMSGMLTNLDVADLFMNTNVASENVDIEAISLMGIGPFSHSGNSASGRNGRLGSNL